jgi:hypothetical protein
MLPRRSAARQLRLPDVGMLRAIPLLARWSVFGTKATDEYHSRSGLDVDFATAAGRARFGS